MNVRLSPRANAARIQIVAAPLGMLGFVLAMSAMLAPWAAVVRTVVHLALDAHHHETSVAGDDLRDAATVLHGHGHEHGIPAHRHDATPTVESGPVAMPGLAVHPSVTAFVSAALAAGAAFRHLLDPSPPPRGPIILRI